MHGWHGQVKQAHADNMAEAKGAEWFEIRPEMRGRGDSTGRPDCNGWELQDNVDAVMFALSRFSDRILDPHLITLTGGSGGGGNVYGLLGKFPDLFCRAKAECGISDYALWYRHDSVGEFRDEMEGQGWVGGTPETNAGGSASRGGLTTVGNLLTPLIIFHGDSDPRVPVEQARVYVEAARKAGKGHLVTYHELAGVGHPGHWGGITAEQEAFRVSAGQEFLRREAKPIQIPRRGRFVVAGYLKTRAFEVILDSVDRVGSVEYDLDKGVFEVRAGTAKRATVRTRGADGGWAERVVDVKRG